GVCALIAPQTSTCFSLPADRYVSSASPFAFTDRRSPVALRSISCAAPAEPAAQSAVTTHAAMTPRRRTYTSLDVNDPRQYPSLELGLRELESEHQRRHGKWGGENVAAGARVPRRAAARQLAEALRSRTLHA